MASETGGHLNSLLALPTCDSGFGDNEEFFLDPLGTIGFAYQSIEVTTLVAKYLINQFYGLGPHHSYWDGCSTGGRQGMVMSQNFPSFFDGILVGDPAYDVESDRLSTIYSVEQVLNVYNANPSLPPPSFLPQPAPQPPLPVLYPAFPAADQALLETALLQACDALTVSQTVSSTTHRHVRRSLIPRLRLIPREARLSPYYKAADNNRDGHMKNSNAVRHPLALQAALEGTVEGCWLRPPGR